MEAATVKRSQSGVEEDSVVWRARVDLAAAHRIGLLEGLHTGSWHHISVKVPGAPERLLISPCDRHWSQVTASSIVEVGPEDTDRLRRRIRRCGSACIFINPYTRLGGTSAA